MSRHAGFTLAGFVLACSCGTSLAQSVEPPPAVVEEQTIGAWTLRVIADEAGAFSRCEVTREDAGIATSFLRGDEGFTLTVANPVWVLPDNQTYEVALEGEGLTSRAFQAETDPSAINIEIGEDPQLIEQIGALETLNLRASQTTIPLPAGGAAEALSEAEACWTRNVALRTNPFAPPGAPAASLTNPFGPPQGQNGPAEQLSQTVPNPGPAAPGDTDPTAVATALTERLNEVLDLGGPTTPTVSFASAQREGDTVVLTDVDFLDSSDPDGLERLRFASAVLTAPVLAADGSLSASRLELRDAALAQQKSDGAWGRLDGPGEVNVEIDAVVLDQPSFLAASAEAADALFKRLRLNELAITGLDITEVDGSPFRTEEFRLALGDIREGIPNAVSGSWTTAPVSAETVGKATDGEAFMGPLGIPEFQFMMTWDMAADPEARTATLRDFTFGLNGADRIAFRMLLGDFLLSEVIPSETVTEAEADAALDRATLREAGFRLENATTLKPMLDAAAAMSGIEPALFLAVIAPQIQTSVTDFTGNAKLGEEVAAAVSKFLEEPSLASVSAAPDEPVTFAAIEEAFAGRAGTKAMVDRLNLSLTVNDLAPIAFAIAAADEATDDDVAVAEVEQCHMLAADSDDPLKPDTVPGIKSPADIDHTAAIPACLAAVEAQPGDPQLLFQLGRSYYAAGRYEEAVARYREAADMGQPVAQYELGSALYAGQGVTQDISQAIQSWEKSAAAGNPYSQHALAIEYIIGEAVPTDYAKARDLLERSAEAGVADAMAELGKMAYRGQGMDVSYEQAFAEFRRAAEAGSANGTFNLGFMHAVGVGGAEKDTERAADLMLQGLAAGDADAQAMLITDSAQGFDQDVRKAIQQRLAEKKLYSGPVDGSFGPATLSALQAYASSGGRG